jgi:hypothetical protein
VAAAEADAKQSVALLTQLVESVPPSHVGWNIPVEPAFLGLHGQTGFAHLLQLLADRAK